jgi:hypothetical protein
MFQVVVGKLAVSKSIPIEFQNKRLLLRKFVHSPKNVANHYPEL